MVSEIFETCPLVRVVSNKSLTGCKQNSSDQKKGGTKSTYNPTKGNLTNIPAQIQVCMPIEEEVSKNASANEKKVIQCLQSVQDTNPMANVITKNDLSL